MAAGTLNRGRRSAILAVGLCLWFGTTASAQTTPTGVPGSGVPSADRIEACGYDTCALRLWEGELFEGREQESVGRFGFLRPPRLRSLLAMSDSAAVHFREVEENYTKGRVTMLGARLVSVAGIVMSFSGDSGVQRWGIGMQVAAFPVGWFGQRQVTRAEEAISRAVWWYNRDVARAEGSRYP